MAKLDLQKLLDKKGWQITQLATASGISRTVLRHLVDGVFDPTSHEHRLILEAIARPDPPKPGAKTVEASANYEAQVGQLDLFGGQP